MTTSSKQNNPAFPMITRRNLLIGLVAAPAIVKYSSIMPINPGLVPGGEWFSTFTYYPPSGNALRSVVREIRATQAKKVLRGGPGWEDTIEKIMRSAGLNPGDGYGTVKITEAQPEYDLTLPGRKFRWTGTDPHVQRRAWASLGQLTAPPGRWII
jgi:hypothetical protein